MSIIWRPGMHAWLREHHGTIDVDALHQIGCRRTQIDRMLRSGELVRILPGAFRSTQWPTIPDQLLVAICRRHPEAIIAFTTAAQHWGYRRLPADAHVHVLVPHCAPTSIPGVTVHRSRRIDEVDVVRRSDGVRFTSPPRTLFDIADMVGPQVTASVVEQVLNDKRFTFATLVDTVARLGHPSRPGARTMRTVLAARPPWRAALQSDLEARVLAAIVAQQLPAPSTQHPLTLTGGRKIRVDFAWPLARVALEVDHPFWHDGWAEGHLDKARDRGMAVQGWRTIRLTSFDVDHGLTEAVAEVGMVIALALAE